MGLGPWGVLVLVFVPLLQIPGMVALSRYVEWKRAKRPAWPPGRETAEATAVSPDAVRCPHCGEANGRTYQYCQSCLCRLR